MAHILILMYLLYTKCESSSFLHSPIDDLSEMKTLKVFIFFFAYSILTFTTFCFRLECILKKFYSMVIKYIREMRKKLQEERFIFFTPDVVLDRRALK